MPIDDRPLNEQRPFDQRSLFERVTQDITPGDVALGVGVAAGVAGLAAVAFSPVGRAAMPIVRRVLKESLGPDIPNSRSFSSEAIASAEWDEDSQTVTLTWRNGSTSEHDCDFQTWLALLSASSKGRFVNEQGWGNN